MFKTVEENRNSHLILDTTKLRGSEAKEFGKMRGD